jgi:predicted TIM-barrel fold metal-dependent hydrolase
VIGTQLVIDAHHHFIPRAIVEDIDRFLPPGFTVTREGNRIHVYEGALRHLTIGGADWSDPEHQLREMDAAGVDVAILSAAVFQQWMTLDAARVFNRELGALQRHYPDRFVGLAHVPPFGYDGAIDELKRAIEEDGLHGLCITTSFRGRYPDEEEYWPLYACADALGIAIFVHAAGCPVESASLDRYGLSSTLGRSIDHALVTARVLYGGVLETFPNVHFMMGHLGGAFYSMVKRLLIEAPGRPGNGIPQRDYAQQLRRIWYDTAPTVWQSPAEIRHAIETLGVDRICFGTDYPAANAVMRDGIELILALDLTPNAQACLYENNARACFHLLEPHGSFCF